MNDTICVYGAWVCYNPKRFEQCKENKRNAELWDKWKPVTFIELVEKNEAFRKLVASGPLLNVDTVEDCKQSVDDWLGKMMNVLEENVN